MTDIKSISVKGYVPGLIAAVTYGMNPLFGLHLYQEGLSTYSVLFYRFTFASVLLALFLLIRKKSFLVPKRQILFLIGSGILLASSCVTWFLSFREMDSGIGAAIMFVYPVMVAVIMAIGYREQLGKTSRLGILLALAGVAALCRPGGNAEVTPLGVIYVLFSSLSYAVYIVIVKESRLRELPPETLTFYVLLMIPFCMLCFLRGGMDLQPLPSWKAFGNALGLAFFPSFLSFFLMAVAVRYIGPTKTAILGAFEPLTAVCIGIFVFEEGCTWTMIGGIVLVLLSVILVVGDRDQKASV